MGIFVSSVYGVIDAYEETSSLKAQEIEQKIELWQSTKSHDFISDFSFEFYKMPATANNSENDGEDSTIATDSLNAE